MPVPFELPSLIASQANEPVIGAIELAIPAPSETLVAWLERQSQTSAQTLIIRTPPEKPVTELMQEAGTIARARYLALDTTAQAAVEDCDFGTINRWLLESDIDALPEDLRAWIRADWVFEVQPLGAERAYISARASAQIRHFDSLLAKVLRVFGGKREYPSVLAYLLDPNDGQRPVRWEAIASALGPERGPLLSNRPAARPANAEPIPFDTPAAVPRPGLEPYPAPLLSPAALSAYLGNGIGEKRAEAILAIAAVLRACPGEALTAGEIVDKLPKDIGLCTDTVTKYRSLIPPELLPP